jgi:hypothetical protein
MPPCPTSPGEPAHFPTDKSQNHYYHARETDATTLQAEFDAPQKERGVFHAVAATQSEKFLFYRGVVAFPPPVTVQAMGGGKVRVTNAAGGKVTGLVLVTVREGAVGFRALNELEVGAESVTSLPAPSARRLMRIGW